MLLTGVVVERTKKRRKDKAILEKIGAASLGIYIVHLMIVYGSPVTMGARYWFNGMLDGVMTPFETFITFMLVTVATSSVVLLWRSFRKHQPQYSKLIGWGWWVGFTIVFMIV